MYTSSSILPNRTEVGLQNRLGYLGSENHAFKNQCFG